MTQEKLMVDPGFSLQLKQYIGGESAETFCTFPNSELTAVFEAVSAIAFLCGGEGASA